MLESVVPHLKLLPSKYWRQYFTDCRELSQPLKKDPLCMTAQEAFEKCLKSGQTVFSQGAAATPYILLDAMTDVGKDKSLENIKVIHMHTVRDAKYTRPEYQKIFRACCLFIGHNLRDSVAEGRADSIPIFLQDVPKLFHMKIIKPDISLIQVSPPDRLGYCSLGTSVDCVRAACVNSNVIIAQINQYMPRTFGDSLIHSSHIDCAVVHNVPLPEEKQIKAFSPAELRIGKLITEELVVDGATLQMGTGNISNAVVSLLKDHRDLGIHSEMFSEGVIDLIKLGNVTNNRKKEHRGRSVTSFLTGTQSLYDYIHDNHAIELLEIDYVNNTHIISLLPNMTAINSAIEIDLTGLVCSDSIGSRMYSGVGGQVDFIRGAAEAVDGQGVPIIAMKSLTNTGDSKIVPLLKVGSGVVTSRAHVHYVVTEYGIANLFGMSLRQRAYELIKIAHPDFREMLEKAAFKRLNVMPSL